MEVPSKPINHVENTVMEAPSKYVAAIAIDFAGSFDILWWSSLTNSLRARNYGNPQKLPRFQNCMAEQLSF